MNTRKSWFISIVVLVTAVLLVAATACGANGEEAAPAAGSGTPASEAVPNDIESAARKLLADELDVAEGGFKLEGSEKAEWPDASLGCPQEGYAYAQVVTPGYKLVFVYADSSYPVYTNSDGSHTVICGDGQ